MVDNDKVKRRGTKWYVHAVGLVVASLVMTSPLVAARASTAMSAAVATSMDASFNGGFVATNPSPLDDEGFAVAVQPDGASVVAGWTGHSPYTVTDGAVLVSRFTAAGRPDTGFGTGGSTVIDAPGTSDKALAVVLQADGRILVAVQYANAPAIVRLTPTGRLDPDFQGGLVTVAEAGVGSANALGVRPDGKIMFAGVDLTRSRLLLGRLNPDGSRDAGFGANGLAGGPLPKDMQARAFSLRPDGGVLMGGSLEAAPGAGVSGVTALARYTAAGELDPAFGESGAVITSFEDQFMYRSGAIAALAVQPDGRIVAAGLATSAYGALPIPMPGGQPPRPPVAHMSDNDVALLRFLPDGRLDPTFGGTGKVITRVPGQSNPDYHTPTADIVPETASRGSALALDASGGILVAGASSQPYYEPLVLRFTPGGLLDTTFGRAGALSVDLGGPLGWFDAMAFGPDGRLVVTGSRRPVTFNHDTYDDLLVARIVPGTNAGTVWSWGWNVLGQLGDGSITDHHVPVQVPGLSGVVAVSAGLDHSLALRGDGTVWAWGWNGLGQLGDGTTTDRHVPVQVPGLSGIVAVTAGGMHSLAVANDGTLWAWGWNAYGQLGDGTTQSRLRPVPVPGLGGLIGASAGLYHSSALRVDGTAWGWGWNGFGEVGDGTASERHAPVVLPSLYAGWAYDAVSAGWVHDASIGVQGEVDTWGWNGLGQVAGAAGGSVLRPGIYFGASLAASAGGYHTLLLQRDGRVVAAGWNAYGQLGDGTVGGPGPRFVVGLRTVSAVSAGGVHSLALTRDRQLWAWGWNGLGQLGSGTTAESHVPVRVGGLPSPAVVSAGGYHSLAISA